MADRLLVAASRALVRDARDSIGDVVEKGAGDRRYRTQVLLLLALVLTLDYADRAGVGALGPDLQRAFRISNTEFGLLASAFSVVGALATVPAGILTDRVRRTMVLVAAVSLWGVAMGATGIATSFLFLVAARVFLGAVTATARPAIMSITGDVFPIGVRGRALGLIGSGEIIGNGVGFLVAGVVAAVFTWRGVFWALGVAGFGLVVLLWRLPEPPRGAGGTPAAGEGEDSTAERLAEAADDVEPDERVVLDGDPARMPFLDAFRYVVRVRTQVLVMTSVAIGSFFFAGLRTFIIVFAVKAYGIDRSVADIALLIAGVGAIGGILAGGRIGDALIARGHLNGRLVVASYSYLFAALVLLPAFLLSSLWTALPLFALGAAAISAPIPPLDAVRLDVVHPQVWGRAEGIRTVLLIAAEAGAPLLFGAVSDLVDGGGANGLRATFLIALSALVASAVLLQVTRRFYPREVAAAAESRA